MISRTYSLRTSNLWMSKLHLYICIIGLRFAFSTKPSNKFNRTVRIYRRRCTAQCHQHILHQRPDHSSGNHLVVSCPLPPLHTQHLHVKFLYPRLPICSARCPSNHPSTLLHHMRPSQPLPIHHPSPFQRLCTIRHHIPFTTFPSPSFSPPPPLSQHQRPSTLRHSPIKG